MGKQGELDLTTEDFAIVRAILNQFVPSRPVFVFGSRVTGRARRRSDLDLAIGGDTPLGSSLRADLMEAFDESDLPIRVDVVDLAEARGVFRQRMESEWLPLEAAAKQLALGNAA
ncbi:nucleotidyltransferase domain-containing protein [Terriglobus sp. RCC_193]|uniref:nucleotidyltransferase domain-containing protein n=1 Tax=Terriglobus sp. RCC_193 TaxID=3239218 RepID=UPI003525514F